MSEFREYSFEEVMNFTVKDIQGPNFVIQVKGGWLKLTPEQQESCRSRLRNLVRERDENVQSTAVNAIELKDRLERAKGPSSLSRTPSPDPEEDERKKLESEKKFHQRLIEAHCWPCYPIELAPQIYRNPGSYKDILEYWGRGLLDDTAPFGGQLNRWNQFRQFQQLNRDYFVPKARFPEFQQKVTERRQKHGLDGNVRLLEDRDEQTNLDHWMEYQDCELRRYESLEEDYKKAQTRVVELRKELADAGLSAYEGIQELEFNTFYAMSSDRSQVTHDAWEKWLSADRNLELAESRLKAAESDDLGERIGRAAWIGFFRKQIEAEQIRLAAVPKYRKEDWVPGGKFYVQEGEDDIDRAAKTREANGRRYDEEFSTGQRLRLAQSGMEAALSDDFGETIERATLIKAAQEEVRSAQIQLEEETRSREKVELKGSMLGALGSVPAARQKMEQHQFLLKWTEQQRCEMASGCASTEKDTDDRGLSEQATSTAFRNHITTRAPGRNKPSKANGHKRKRSTEGPILNPSNASKVTKAPSKRRSSRQKMKVQCNASQPADKATTDVDTPESGDNKASKAKDSTPAFLRSVRFSRISKPSRERSTGQRGNGSQLLKENGLAPSLNPSTGRNKMQQSASASLRRTTRISKRPERFRPG